MIPSLEQLLCSHYIKYENMYKMVYDNFAGSNADTLNIYIDLYSVIKPIYTQQCTIDDYHTIVSSIINMCAHYREFFSRAPLCVKTNIYLVYSENTSEVNKKFYKGYNRHMDESIINNPRIDEMVKKNFNLLHILAPYLPNIYFIQGTFETGVIMYDLILNNTLTTPQVPSLIISKDQYLYQLPALNDNIVLFRPKKNSNGDCSYYVNKRNVLSVYLAENKIKYTIEENYPEMYSLLLALSHCRFRGISMELNITNAYKTILNLIHYNIISRNHQIIMDNILQDFILKLTGKNIVNLEQRFKCIDIPFQECIYSTSIEKTNSICAIQDLINPKQVQEINNMYFIKHPLDLNRL